MEVYAGSIATIKHTIYIDGESYDAQNDVMLTVFDSDGNQLATKIADETFTEAGPHYEVVLGQEFTNDYETKTMQWEYLVANEEVITPPEYLIVVNPYVTYQQFKAMYPETTLGYSEFALVEPVVRKVIEAYCNQTFTREDNVSYIVTGSSSDSLALPRQLIELTSLQVMDPHVTGAGVETPYDITTYAVMDPDDRWSIRRRTSWPVNRGISSTHNRSFFKYPTRYRITGNWGWDMVPQDITRAAAILVNDYECSDAKYREKYISVMRAGDGRWEYALTGDETTGNANADMILWRYRNIGLAVI